MTPERWAQALRVISTSSFDSFSLDDIRQRWEGTNTFYCTSCIGEAWRNWDRNCEPACGEQYNLHKHPGRYDGEAWAVAGRDIHVLLDKIKQLEERVALFTPLSSTLDPFNP